MGWSQAFLESLAGNPPRKAVWALQLVRSTDGATEGALITSQAGALLPAGQISSPPQVGSAKVAPISWAYSSATWSVGVVGEEPGALIRNFPRGSIVRLLMGWTAELGALHPVALGIVRYVTGGPDGYQITCWDLTTGLSTRLTTDPDEMNLFWDVVQETTTAAGYTVGDANLNITDASIMQRESGGSGVVRLTPDAGDDFYLTYTGVTANTLNGLSATGQFGTTAGNAANGNAIANVAYLKGHPLDVARKVMISGSGSGAYDTYPDNWGMMLEEGLFDNQDINSWRDAALIPASGNYEIEIIIEEPITDAWAWLSGLLSSFGIWPVSRQGLVSFRACQSSGDPKLVEGTVISESDLLEGPWRWESQAAEFTHQYGEVVVSGDGFAVSAGVTRVDQFPSLDTYNYDLTSYVWNNVASIVGEVSGRVQDWALHPPEAFDLNLRGHRCAGLVPGDVVYLELPRLRGRRTARGQGYSGVRAAVAQVAPDWSRHTTKLRVYPAQEW